MKDTLDEWIDAACEDGFDLTASSEFDDDDAGPPLLIEDLQNAREDLAQWRSPSDFRCAVHLLHKRCRSPEFKDPRRQFLLDAWTLAEFVRHKLVDHVRLAGPSEQWPDGYVRIGNTVENAIPGALEKAITDKIAKRYGTKMWLIVYLNMNDYGNPAIPNRASHRRHQAALRGCIRPIVCDLEG